MIVTLYLIHTNVYNSVEAPKDRGFSYIEIWMIGTQVPILLALMGSGFNGQSFAFHGYLPIDKKARISAIKKLEKDAARLNQTQIFMDTPYRNQHLLKDLISNCSNHALLSIARDITGKDELIKTLPISQWKKEKTELHKVPVIFSLYVQ